jgi:dihydrofolate synthase/folylpolyglutamate synthase
MAAALQTIPHTGTHERYNSVHEALNVIMPTQQSDTLLIVFGSFFTVADAINYFKK